VNQNPYAPPTAPVSDQGQDAAKAGDTPFFAVSALKLVVMSLCTFGLYEVYWFYRQWKSLKELGRARGVSPVPRAIFAVLFCYQCFARIRDYSEDQLPGGKAFLAGPLAAAWIISTLVWRLPEPYSLISFLSSLFLVPVQACANRLNAKEAPGHDRNARIQGWNWLAVTAGALLFILSIVGAFIQVPPGES